MGLGWEGDGGLVSGAGTLTKNLRFTPIAHKYYSTNKGADRNFCNQDTDLFSNL